MPEILPTIRELLRGNRVLPRTVAQSRVLIRFRKPVPRWYCSEFMRIKLTEQMLAGGETRYVVSPTQWATARGVVGVELCPEWILNPTDPPQKQEVTALCLVLDRRYREEVLAAVYRTAGMVADDLGAGIK